MEESITMSAKGVKDNERRKQRWILYLRFRAS